MGTQIVSYCKIKNNSVWVNGKLVKEFDTKEDATGFLSELYKVMDLNYPKFFKMDKLCKLGTLAAELVIRDVKAFPEFQKDQVALVFSNNAASLDTDRTHANTIADKKNYFPSPSVFVYTLANIVIGEIAIKHKVSGENAFFVSETFNAELMTSYTESLLSEDHTDTVLAGWVNVDGSDLEAFVYCVKNLNFKSENSSPHNLENIQHLYTH